MKTFPALIARIKPHLLWLTLLVVVAVLPLGRSLLSTTEVLSEQNTDVTLHFLYSRAFGFEEMAKGNLPLWNPYIYSGIPYLGQFQSALLYPPNLIFLVLPLATAINWSFALHLFLLGAGMYFWAVFRGLKSAAAFVAGVTAMLGGAVMLHIYAGHLSNVCSIAWIPFVLLGIDGWLKRRHAGWLAVSAAAVALQIYAGHPQYFYYTALVAGLYSVVHLPGTPRVWIAALGLAAIYPVGAMLASAQLIPGITATSEAVRSGGVAYEFSAMFSFPPENFLTLLAPWVFGDMRAVPYWGRCYLWEMSVFAGTGMLVFACFGAGRKLENGGRLRLLIVLGCVVVLALGMHTPLHKILYQVLPGFSSFRGSSKFIIFAALFLALFAGLGFDRLLRREKFPRLLGAALAVLGLLLLGASFLITGDRLMGFVNLIAATKESYLHPAAFEQGTLLAAAQDMAGQSLRVSGGLFLGFAALLYGTNRWRWAVWAVGLAAVAELVVFARGTVATFPLADFTYQPVADFLKNNPGDFRTLNLFNADAAMLLRSENIWGYDPGVLKRYAQLLHLSQGNDPEAANQYLSFRAAHPILAMLRCRYAFVPKEGGQIDVTTMADPFPRFALYSQYRVLADSKAVLGELKSPWFDLRKEVLLETEPVPKPEHETPRHNIRVVDSSTDHWTLEIETDRAALLVMTDSYSQDWRAIALPGSVQSNYTLQPANYALRAIPLAAGKHALRLEYVPRGFREGIALSVITLLVVGVALSWRPLRERLDFDKTA